MTRAAVFVAAALLTASVGVYSQDASNSSAAKPAAAQVAVQNAQSAKPADMQASPPASDPAAPQTSQAAVPNGRDAHDSGQRPATSHRATAIEGEGSATGGVSPGTNAGAQLPQTSTILPLLGLIGLGSLVAGLFARR